MYSRLIQSTSILLVLTATTMAQVRGQPGPSLQQRQQQLEPFISASARSYGIDPRILRAVCFIESRFRNDAVSPKGAGGPMQFMPATARRYGLQNPHDPKAAIDAAAHYLRDLLTKFGGRLDLALAAYNAGEGTVESFQIGKPLVLATGQIINPHGVITGGVPPYRETETYVRSAIRLLIADTYSTVPRLTSSRPRNGPTMRDDRDQNKRSRSAATSSTRSSFIEVQ